MISSAIFGIENNGLLGITALLTGAALVFLALDKPPQPQFI